MSKILSAEKLQERTQLKIRKQAEIIAAQVDAQTQKLIKQAVKEAEKRLIIRMVAWFNKQIPSILKMDSVGSITCNGEIIEIFLCDEYGDEVPDTALELKRKKRNKI